MIRPELAVGSEVLLLRSCQAVVCRLVTRSRRPVTIRGLAALMGGQLLFACPQLLDDGFDSATAGGSGGVATATGGSAGGGAGGEMSAAGMGGESAGASGAGASSGGAGGGAGLDGGSSSDASGGASAGDASSSGGAAGDALDGGISLDASDADGPGAVLRAALLHRYRFDGSGSGITDSIGTAHGFAINCTLAGAGKIALSGSDQYINLPNGLISGRQSVTLETWVNWQADPASTAAEWQTLFSFGESTAGEDLQGDGTTYIYLTAKALDSGDIRGGYTLNRYQNEIFADGAAALPLSADTARGTHVALVVDGAQGRLSIYIDGALDVSTSSGQLIDLSAINDVNNWIGRSQHGTDPEFHGEVLEFRIYGTALDAAQLSLSFELGPDASL